MKHYRTRAHLTAEQLSGKTDDLGYPLSRNMITALETGRKEYVSVQDLTVLAVALDVVPALLLFPVNETSAPVDLLPGTPVDRLDAIRWLNAQGFLTGPPLRNRADAVSRKAWTQNNDVIYWLRGHAEGVQQWRSAVAMAADDPADKNAITLKAQAELQIRGNRQYLHAGGYPLPELPPGCSVDGEYVDPLDGKNVAIRYVSGRELRS